MAAKIYPAYEVKLGGIFSSAIQSSGEQCLMDVAALTRSFLMIYDGAALQYITDPTATAHRTLFFMTLDALLTKAGV